jgi:hypothetical protein
MNFGRFNGFGKLTTPVPRTRRRANCSGQAPSATCRAYQREHTSGVARLKGAASGTSSERGQRVGLVDTAAGVESGQPSIAMSLVKRVLMWYSLSKSTYKQQDWHLVGLEP